jgi:hypothetical protein
MISQFPCAVACPEDQAVCAQYPFRREIAVMKREWQAARLLPSIREPISCETVPA